MRVGLRNLPPKFLVATCEHLGRRIQKLVVGLFGATSGISRSQEGVATTVAATCAAPVNLGLFHSLCQIWQSPEACLCVDAGWSVDIEDGMAVAATAWGIIAEPAAALAGF